MTRKTTDRATASGITVRRRLGRVYIELPVEVAEALGLFATLRTINGRRRAHVFFRGRLIAGTD